MNDAEYRADKAEEALFLMMAERDRLAQDNRDLTDACDEKAAEIERLAAQALSLDGELMEAAAERDRWREAYEAAEELMSDEVRGSGPLSERAAKRLIAARQALELEEE